MTCADVLTRLLEVEPEELEGKGASPVAVHVRECARCRAVASRLLSDTLVLAAHVATRDPAARSVRPAVSRPVLWGGALAVAAILAWLVVQERRVPGPRAVRAPALVRSPPQVNPPSNPTALVSVRARGAVGATRFADVAPATPVRFIASQAVERPMPPDDSGSVSVTPPAGTHAAVLATRNARITVVWLY